MNMLEFLKQKFRFVLALTAYRTKFGSLLEFKVGPGAFEHGVLDIVIGNAHALTDNLGLFLLNLVGLTVTGIVVVYGRPQSLVTEH